MKMRFPLYAQIATVFFCNLLLLFCVYACFFSSQFHLGWEALLYSPIGDRIQSIAFVIRRQIKALPNKEWNHVLAEFGEFYGVKFYLFDPKGHQLGGESVQLPLQVRQRIMDIPPSLRHHDHGAAVSAASKAAPSSAAMQVSDSAALQVPNSTALQVPGSAVPQAPYSAALQVPSSAVPQAPYSAALQVPGSAALQVPNSAAFQLPGSSALQVPGEVALQRTQGGLNSDLPMSLGAVPPCAPFSAIRAQSRFFVHTNNPDMTWIGAYITNQKLSGTGTLLAAAPNLWQTRLIFDFGPVLSLCFGVFALSLVVWWPFIYGISSSLNRLTSTTERIAEGKFDTSLKTHRSDEIGRLSQAISVMSGKLKMFLSGQKRFLGDIAHELCSPVARLQIGIAILENSCTEEQSATINDIREEVEQMSSLINELLAFSKAGIRGQNLQLVNVDLSVLLHKVSSTPSVSHTPMLEIQDTITCLGDELLLERAFGNILRNADRYAGESGPLVIKASQIDNDIVVSFADNGPGVQPETLEMLGEPFYRPEQSRNRSSGGVGLGLAIVKTCIEACQGTVTLRNRQPKGLEVEVKLLASV